MQLKITFSLILYFILYFNSSTYSQTNINKLDSILQYIDKKQNYIDLATHYAKTDTIKYKALFYLLENINEFTHNDYVITSDYSLSKKIFLADLLYFKLVSNKSYDEITSNAIQDSIQKIGKYVQSIPWENINKEYKISSEDSPFISLTAEKIKDHIEHSFYLRDSSPIIKAISENDFYNYVLPYQARYGRHISVSSKDFYDILSKYISCDIRDISEVVKLYVLTINNFRNILGDYPIKNKMGFEEVFFKNVQGWDCYDVSNFGCAFLNSIGIPTKSENVIAYKMLRGRHSHCAIVESAGNYSTFSLEGEDFYPIKRSDSSFYDNTMNIIEENFAIQLMSPFKLKSNDEDIPDFLNNPRIEDITKKRLKTVSETFSINVPTNNNLCYLASSNSYNGKAPVAWTKIDKNNNTATFDNIIVNRLYFPVILQDGQYIDIASPFMYIEDKSTSKNKFKKIEFDGKKTKSLKDIYITRKFPRKEKMIKVAKDLIGTTVIASDQSSFKDRDTLYTLDFELTPYLQDIELNNSKPYQYYRIESPAHSRKMNLSEVQYLTSKTFNYSNSIDPTPLPILKKQDISNTNKDLIRIVEDSIQKINHWPEYDGKMTTAPNAYPNVTFRLKTPQIVTHIRVSPLNADNGIEVGNEYILMEYVNGQWINQQQEIAEYNYIYSKSLKMNTLYWLKNITKGKEELAFYINDKKEQVFIYQ